MKPATKDSIVPKNWVQQTPALKNNTNVRNQLISYFKLTYEAYEKLFELLKTD